MNKNDMQNLNEAYDQIHGEAAKPMINARKLSPSVTDGPKWVKLIRDEMGIGPRDHNAEEAVYYFLDQPISQYFRVRKTQGKYMPGIKIMFDDGSHGLAFGVNPQSSVSKVLAATYQSYKDTFEKIAEVAIGQSADEYEGM